MSNNVLFPIKVVRNMVLLLLLVDIGQSRAQIVVDGTLGPAGPLQGPQYQIPSTLGQIYGPNLFHSFRDFNLAGGESATFSGPGSVSNILSRVTGGNPSLINGSINSTIAGANLFFLNPSGIVFGPTGQVNVSGSFIASTADYLRLKDGSTFGITGSGAPSTSLLTSAPPAAFGFLNPQPAPIITVGTILQSSPGQSLSLVGGNIRLDDSLLYAAGARVNILSVGSAGEIKFDPTQDDVLPVLDGFSKLGDISLNTTFIAIGDDPFGIGDPNVGESKVVMRGGNLTMNNFSEILARNAGSHSGGVADLEVGDTLELTGFSSIKSSAEGAGQGTDILIKAKSLRIAEGALLSSTANADGPGGNITLKADDVVVNGRNGFVAVDASTKGESRGGHINIEARSLQVLDDALITTNTSGRGEGGHINIKAENVLVNGQNEFVAVAATTEGEGRGGHINIEAKDLKVLNNALVSAQTSGSGEGGDINIKAGDLLIKGQDGQQGTPTIDASTSGFVGGGNGGNINIDAQTLHVAKGDIQTPAISGRGGDINIHAGGLQVSDKGSISALTLQNRGGNISIEADTIEVNGQGGSASIGAFTLGAGQSGDVSIKTKKLEILHGADITTATLDSGAAGNIAIQADDVLVDGQGDQGISSSISASGFIGSIGPGGNITLQAKNVQISNKGEISCTTFGQGAGGSIHIQAQDIQLLRGSINANTLVGGNAGNITVQADTLRLDGQNQGLNLAISAFTAPGTVGNAGNITLKVKNMTITGGAQIDAGTLGLGHGGHIFITADELKLEGPNFFMISANTGTGARGGDIEINAKSLQIVNGAAIQTSTTGSGNAGDITIITDDLLIDGQGQDTGVFALALDDQSGGVIGASGNIAVTAHNTLQIRNGANITTANQGTRDGGDIVVNGGTVILDGQGPVTGISADTLALVNGGKGGDIEINASHLHVLNGAAIGSNTRGSGDGGNIVVRADEVLLDKQASSDSLFTGISSSTVTTPGGAPVQSGNGGIIELHTKSLKIVNGAAISGITANNGVGGDVFIEADSIVLGGQNSSVITSQTSSNNSRAGDITVDAQSLQIANGASLLSTTVGGGDGGTINLTLKTLHLRDGGFISASTEGSGSGGDVTIHAGTVDLSRASVETKANNTGDAGNITLNATDSVNLNDHSEILAFAEHSDGGDITVNAANGIHLRDSNIFSFAEGNGGNIHLKAGQIVSLLNSELNAQAKGDGGNITIEPHSGALPFVVFNNGDLTANAFLGKGGDITIRSDFFISSADSVISASSEFGAPGAILVEAPDPNLGASLRRLPANPLAAEDELQARCSLRRGKVSSFVVRRQGSTLPEPSGPLPSSGVK